uniref:Uncharacterized protein n=1 Tax=Anguilla anguilla TaxID=7936 RepID=A0A0E9RA53_ANGAN
MYYVHNFFLLHGFWFSFRFSFRFQPDSLTGIVGNNQP